MTKIYIYIYLITLYNIYIDHSYNYLLLYILYILFCYENL